MIRNRPLFFVMLIPLFFKTGLVLGQVQKKTDKPVSYTAKFSQTPAYIKGGNWRNNDAIPTVAAPQISYQTPQIYTLNSPIVSLIPSNTGGAVPATIYGQASYYAGNGGTGTRNGPASNATFFNVTGVTADAAGNVYVCDWANNMIREISTDGMVSTLAGSTMQGSANGQGAAASFFEPDGIIVDATGNVLVGDQGNNLIRKITPQGLVTTFAGTGLVGSADGLITAASFYNPRALATDAAGNVYVADQQNNLIRKISPQGYVTTLAGSGAQGFADGTGKAAIFNWPTGVGTDLAGNVYVADANNNAIRKITPAGVVTTVAGNGSQGNADGIGAAARFNFPREVRADGTGNLYVSDANNDLVRRITPAGVVTTIAGEGRIRFSYPLGLTLDGKGNLYVGDDNANRVDKVIISGYTIDKTLPAGLSFDPTTGIISGTPTALSPAANYTITGWNGGGSSSVVINITVNDAASPVAAPNISYQTPQTYTINTAIATLAPANTGGAVLATIGGEVTTLAGNGKPGAADGIWHTASFNGPRGMCVDAAGNVFVADAGNNLIRKITPDGVVSTFAGTGGVGLANGFRTSASFYSPTGIAIDVSGNLYIADTDNNMIRKITPDGVVSTLAGSGPLPRGQVSTSFTNPEGIAVDGSGNVFFTDANYSVIRKLTADGTVTTFAGNGTAGSVDGSLASASFNGPVGLALDKAGNFYVTEAGDYLVRKIGADGVVSTLAGVKGYGNLAVDKDGNVFVPGVFTNIIYKVAPDGTVSAFAGAGASGMADGPATTATFNAPGGAAVDNLGNVYISEEKNHAIRRISRTGYTIDKPLPAGLSFDATTGTISGTPTVLSPPVDYTVTAYNSGGSSATVVSIQVVDYTLKPSIITFLPISPNTDQYGNIPGSATSTNTESPITYTSSDTTVAIILPNGIIHAKAPGNTIITAYQNGNSNFSPATPVPVTLTLIESQLIDFPVFIAAHPCDDDFAAGASTSNPFLPLTYSSSDPSVATISAQGIIHIIGAGSTTITVSQDGNTLFAPATPESEVLTVTSPTALAVSIKPDAVAICSATQVSFIATVSGDVNNPNFQWQLNGQNVGTNSGSVTLSGLNNNDMLQCTVTNSGKCPASATTTLTVAITPATTPSVSIQSDHTGVVCAGTNVSFTATPANGGTSPTYQWQVNGVNAGTNNPVFASSTFADGDVVTCLLTNNDTPCLTTSTVTSNSVKVSLYPVSTLVPSVTVNPESFGSCVDLSVTYTATAKNAGTNPTYQWQVNGQIAGTNDSTFTSSSLTTGDKITCTITSSVQCYMNTATSNVATIDTDPLYYYSATIKSSVTNNIATQGQQVTFTATVTDTTDAIYQWRVNDIVVGANSQVFTTASLVNGDKVDCLVAIGGKCLAAPFVTSNTITIIVYTPVVIPNTFTPNGDGINDNWDMPSLTTYPGCTVSVFTRHGELVYNSTGYPKAWDGNYNGKPLPTGTYYYVIDLKKAGSQPLSGFLVIVR